MENENNTSIEQTISVIKQPDGYIVIAKGTGKDLSLSAVSVLKSIFVNILNEWQKYDDASGLIVNLWNDFAFAPLHAILADDKIDSMARLIAAKAMAKILTNMHSFSSKELKDIFDDVEDSDDDEDSNDSSID